MTEEERQRQMDFILEQQAQIVVKVDALAEAQSRAEQRWGRTEEGIRSLLAIAEIHEREITALGETTRATDERLNALVNVFERYISERRNGESQ